MSDLVVVSNKSMFGVKIATMLIYVALLLPHHGVMSSSAAGSETLIGIKGKDFVLLATSSGVSGNGVAFTSTYIDKIHILQPSQYNHNLYADEDTNDSRTVDDESNVPQLPKVHPVAFVIPTVAIAAIGNYADIDQMIRRIRAEYNIYHYEALTYRTTLTTTNTNYKEMEIIDCHPNLLQESSLTDHSQLQPQQRHKYNDFSDDNAFLSVDQLAHMIRNQIMTQLRSVAPYRMCTLMAGFLKSPLQQRRPSSSSSPPQEPKGKKEERLDSGNDDDVATATFSSATTTTKIELAEHLQHQVRRVTFSNRILSDVKNTVNTNVNSIESSDVHPNDDDSSDASTTSVTNNNNEPVLYWLDEYGSMIDHIPYGVHGYASDMIYSILDQKYHAALSKDEAIQLLQECIQQLQTRYMMNTQQQQQQQQLSSSSSTNPKKSFCIKLIDQYGCTQL